MPLGRQWIPCGRIYTAGESDAANREAAGRQASLERRRHADNDAMTALRSVSDPIERMMRAVAAFVTIGELTSSDWRGPRLGETGNETMLHISESPSSALVGNCTLRPTGTLTRLRVGSPVQQPQGQLVQPARWPGQNPGEVAFVAKQSARWFRVAAVPKSRRGSFLQKFFNQTMALNPGSSQRTGVCTPDGVRVTTVARLRDSWACRDLCT